MRPATQIHYESIERADRARKLLDDQTFNEVLESVRMHFVGQIEASPIGDRDFHHEAALTLQALKTIRRQLQKWIDDAEVEKSRLSNP